MKNLFKLFVMLFAITAFAACNNTTEADADATDNGDNTEMTDQAADQGDVATPEGETTDAETTTPEGEGTEQTEGAESNADAAAAEDVDAAKTDEAPAAAAEGAEAR